MRTAFIEQLTMEASKNDKIFLLVADLGFSVVEKFAEQFPNRFLNTGIAEQNTMGVAAGLAMEGFIVYIYSIGNFPTLRCMEQIRNDVAYPKLNVRIVSVGCGYAYGSLSVSHHATEELGMLRTLPNMIVTAPGDPAEVKAIISYSTQNVGPLYIRLGKAGEPVIHSSEIENIYAGQIFPIITSQQAQTAILTTGGMLDYAKGYIIENRKEYNLYSCPFVKPIDIEALNQIANRYPEIITLEEHQLSAGFGSAVIEQVNDLFAQGKIKRYPKITRKGIQDEFLSISGSQKYLWTKAGLLL
jgi:transketolase